MTWAKAIGAVIAATLALHIMVLAQRDKREGRPWYVYAWGYGAALAWAVAAYVAATGV